ncbi:NAD(P)-dependent oxidoreductase [Jiella mangrovi]|uniref:NAD(P)-dependent oxidoreductase n=1 Tax=Jiella mangrovi TaxID=2821407 RepID=A0ABS4BJE7_9HYPH|nr:NAD(P)-dependent oxidoreductase [Jiella mangrovi]MBP0616871.1 NAD(P)-dependent oxidoreductase [Jiella mangrovi]
MDDATRQSAAVIGAGIMGAAITERLLSVGFTVTIYNRDQDKLKPLEKLGARAASTPCEAAANTDYVVVCLTYADVVEDAIFGTEGVAGSAGPDKLLIDMSSIDPDATKRMAERLRRETGMGWIDCPLSGGAPGARTGTLTVMAGGSAEDFERGRAVMDHLCANYNHMGPSGAGQATKLINQLFCGLLFQGVAEAVVLAEAAGIDPGKVPAALKGGRGDSRILQEYMGKFAARDHTPTGRLDNMMKDLETLQSFAHKTRTPLPLTTAVADIHRILIRMGLGAADMSEMIRLLEPTDD